MPGALFEARLLFRPGTFRIAFAPAKNAPFSQLSLCLSRASLGKMIVFSSKMVQNGRFSHRVLQSYGYVIVTCTETATRSPGPTGGGAGGGGGDAWHASSHSPLLLMFPPGEGKQVAFTWSQEKRTDGGGGGAGFGCPDGGQTAEALNTGHACTKRH